MADESGDATLLALARRACSRSPVSCDPQALASHVATLVDAGLSAPTELHWDDLVLAYACGRGDPGASREFLRRYSDEMTQGFANLATGGHSVSDLRQQVAEKVLVASGTRPARILSYAGRSSLRRWVRVVAMRMRADRARTLAARPPRLAAHPDAIDAANPQAAATEAEAPMHARIDLTVRDRVRQELAALRDEERDLLRRRWLEGESPQELGEALGVHKSSVNRRLGRVYDRVRRGVRRSVLAHLGLSGEETERVIAELEVSLHGALDAELEPGLEPGLNPGLDAGAAPPGPAPQPAPAPSAAHDDDNSEPA